MKIYLQYPWKFPDSPYYKYLIQSPPPEAEYLNVANQKGVITSKKFFWFSNFLKRNIRMATNLFNLAIPNAHLSPRGEYSLIHCAHCLSKNTDKPWVADMEGVWSMGISGMNTTRGRNKVREILLRKNCKKIMPWSESTKEEILKVFPEIKDKLEVVYPAVPEIKNLRKLAHKRVSSSKQSNKKLKIIFVARYFDIKGGRIALEVLERLTKKHNIEGIVVSDVPNELKEKYTNIRIIGLIPQKELFSLLATADLFLYPSAIDTFGFSLLEAMAFGLPVITINTVHTKSRKEIVQNGKTGLIFDVFEKVKYDKITATEEKIISKLITNAEKLILNKRLRQKMSANCIVEIRTGKFSIEKRNRKLSKIYSYAIE